MGHSWWTICWSNKSLILMSNIQNISVQKNTSSFETAIFWRIVCKQRDGYFGKKILLSINLIVRFLLNYRMYRTVLFLKKIQILIKRVSSILWYLIKESCKVLNIFNYMIERVGWLLWWTIVLYQKKFI